RPTRFRLGHETMPQTAVGLSAHQRSRTTRKTRPPVHDETSERRAVLLGAPATIRALPLLGVLCVLAALFVPAAGRSAGTSGSLDAKALIRKATTLTTPKMSHWAIVARQVDVHRLPTASSPVVTRLDTVTGDGTQNIVLVLSGAKVSGGGTCYLV